MEEEYFDRFNSGDPDFMSCVFSDLRIDDNSLLADEEEPNETYINGNYTDDEYINAISTVWRPNEVAMVDFYCKEQAQKHRTYDFDLVKGMRPSPVLRRGASFFFAIRFKRPYYTEKDKLHVILAFGKRDRDVRYPGSFVTLEVTKKESFDRDVSRWDVYVSRQTEDEVILAVQIPTSAAVGVWRLAIVSGAHNSPVLSTNSSVYKCPEYICILFNPWCEDDSVYMENETWRQEYVLNDVGKLYNGTHNQPFGRPWVFGQFDSVVLPASMFILEKSDLHFKSRGDPIKIVRALSAMININDDNGVIHGRWLKPGEVYADGTAPTSWTGSIEILKQYLNSGGIPVKYGQCWVFSGVFTTVCRALGIPCRSVTNFNSAHDGDANYTIDTYYSTSGKVEKADLTWNFHVWNDCWMTRPDLPSGYGGWQAVDATPQERSDGIFRTGPASVLAIRRGEISFMYDCPFIFSEVNADRVSWTRDYTSETGWKPVSLDTTDVGKLIVTKKVGYDDEDGITDMEDITKEYKPQEGEKEERMSVLNAVRRRRSLLDLYDIPSPSSEDVEFSLQDIDKVMIGKPINMIVKVWNKSSQSRTVTAVLCCSSVYYTGVHSKEVKKETGSFSLQPNQREQLVMDLDFDDYYDKLVEFSMMKIYALATVNDTNQTWSAEDDFRVEKPRLLLEVEHRVKKKQPFNLRISFTNPLQRHLQECQLSIEVPGIGRRVIKLSDVRRGEKMTRQVRLKPTKSGKVHIVAVFNSVQLIDIVGSKIVLVED